jgi:hypothetical protein
MRTSIPISLLTSDMHPSTGSRDAASVAIKFTIQNPGMTGRRYEMYSEEFRLTWKDAPNIVEYVGYYTRSSLWMNLS